MRKIICLAIFLILLSGCMDVIGSSSDYRNEYSKYLSKRIAADSEAEECRLGNCTCMICQNKSYFFSIWSSFAGGKCFFHHPCNETEFENYNRGVYGNDYASRNFMYGAGPSFFDFGESNKYCNGKQTMAVHWLTGSEGRDYDLPDAGRAMCMLQKEVIPVYVLYSGGENIDAGRSYSIGEELGRKASEVTMGRITGSAGPVIITTEINYELDDVDKIVEQIYQLNYGCNNHPPNDIKCFVALAPKIGDKEALDAVMNELGNNKDYVQMLAFGIDSHYSNESCNVGGSKGLGRMAEDFAAYGLYEYGLPSVVPYVLLDQGTVDPITECIWDERAVTEGYKYFFPSGSITLRDVGVIGIAPYSFNSSQWGGDPLKCNDCDIAANLKRLESWYGGCQRITKIAELQQGGGYAIVFPNESGGNCNYVTQTDYFGSLYKDSPGMDILTDPVTPLEELENITWRCDACIANGQDLYELYPVLKKYEDNKDEYKWVSRIINGVENGKCEAYPEINYYSSRSNVDPMLVRGVIQMESNWNPCSVSCAGRGGMGGEFITADGRTKNCVGGKYSVGYDEIHDPDHVYYEDKGYCEDLPALANPANPGDYRFLAMGIMQIMNSPYSYWPVDEGGTGMYEDFFLDARDRGRTENVDAARFCSEEFNPFNASHNICRGTAQLGGVMQNGSVNWMNDAEARCKGKTRGRVTDPFHRSDRRREEVMKAFVSTYMLSGVWKSKSLDIPACGNQEWGDCLADYYCEAIDLYEISLGCKELAPGVYHKGCVGEGEPDKSKCYDICWDTRSPTRCNFIEFVDCMVDRRELLGELSADAGLKKIFAYNYYNQNCNNSFCPPYRQWEDDPVVMSKINPDMIDETGEIYDDQWRYLGPAPGDT